MLGVRYQGSGFRFWVLSSRFKVQSSKNPVNQFNQLNPGSEFVRSGFLVQGSWF